MNSEITEEEYQLALAEFLANNKPEQIPMGKSSPQAGTSGWGHSKPKAVVVPKPVKSVKPKKAKK